MCTAVMYVHVNVVFVFVCIFVGAPQALPALPESVLMLYGGEDASLFLQV